MKKIPFGKRLKSSEPIKMFYRFPNSGDIKTLPAGQPSPIIDSYIERNGVGYYQLLGDNNGNYYVKDTPGVNVVEADEKDDSGAVSKIWGGFSDLIGNSARDVSRNAGYLGEGFDKSISMLGGDLFKIGGIAKKAVAIIIAFLLLLIGLQILTKID